MFQGCLFMEEVQQLYHQMENVYLGRIKINKLSDISITENKITQEPDNQSKKSKVISSIDETKINVELTPPPKKNNQDYTGGTNDETNYYQTHESEDSRSDTGGCEINLDEGHKNEEDDDYIDPPLKIYI